MPDVYAKGQPHVPVADIGGHYVGMHAPERPEVFKPEKLWWRGDEYAALQAEVEKLKQARELSAQASATMRDESLEKSARIVDLESRLVAAVTRCNELEALHAAATKRRPPKRAGLSESNGE